MRDSADSWYKSVLDTIAQVGKVPTAESLAARRAEGVAEGFPEMLSRVLWHNPRLFAGGIHAGEGEQAKEVYTKWIADVKAVVPEAQLLVFNVKQGWQPLCDFLGVPVPDTPFPRVNDTEQFRAHRGPRK